ncbi:hypothetical protein DFAR_220008 [Desulfarculales bacterium]
MIIAADNFSAVHPSLRWAIEKRNAQAIGRICQQAATARAQWLDLNPGFVPPARWAEA